MACRALHRALAPARACGEWGSQTTAALCARSASGDASTSSHEGNSSRPRGRGRGLLPAQQHVWELLKSKARPGDIARELMEPSVRARDPRDSPLVRWRMEMDERRKHGVPRRIGDANAPGGLLPSKSKNLTKFFGERAAAELRRWRRERMRVQRVYYQQQYAAEQERRAMEEWAARWRQRTELQLFQEVWAMEFGQEEWEARARRRQADEEVRRVAAQGRAVRGVTRLLREAELKQCREDFLAELARRAQSWITEDTLDARIAHALAHPEPLRSARERLAPLRIAAPRMAIVDELDASDVAKPRADRRALLRAELERKARLAAMDLSKINLTGTEAELSRQLAKLFPEKRTPVVPSWAKT